MQSCTHGYIYIYYIYIFTHTHVYRSLCNWWAALNILMESGATSFYFNNLSFFTRPFAGLPSQPVKMTPLERAYWILQKSLGTQQSNGVVTFSFWCSENYVNKNICLLQEGLLKKRWIFVNVEISALNLRFASVRNTKKGSTDRD